MASILQKIRKWLYRILYYGMFSVFFILLVVEFIYRYQFIDTYMPELRSYNLEEDFAGCVKKKTILIMGDSMTAGNESYPAIMRNRLPSYRVINSGVSGTCVYEASLIVPKRFKEFRPEIFIYQVYLGNDLFEINHPVNWQTVSFLRNIYWGLSDHIKSLVYLNYRFAQQFVGLHKLLSGRTGSRFDNELKVDLGIDKTEAFSVEKYTIRPKVNLQAEPYLLENQIMVENGRKKDFEYFLKKLDKVLSFCLDYDCKAYILVIPHCAQINRQYLGNMESIGAKFNHPLEIFKNEYPFIVKIREAFTGKTNLTILNPIQALREKEAGGDFMYFQNDDHLTRKGQETIAEFVLKNLNIK